MSSSRHQESDQFADDVLAGLSESPKRLSSKYFYDDQGSRLFQQIMALPEYYPTRCESEIFSAQADDIFRAFSHDVDNFDLVELGAGDGSKTAILIEHFQARRARFAYSPIDISAQAVEELSSQFRGRFPALDIRPKQGDYFQILGSLKQQAHGRRILLFLGSNIGNFGRERAIDFFRQLRSVMGENDLLFTGFDLQKDPHVIAEAYDDSQGVTAAFNLNLLARINRELGGDFNLEKFSHYAIYSPIECAARSFLVSREKQSVHIRSLNRSFDFEAWEAVFMEISQKYNAPMIEEFARLSGFEVAENFLDSRQYFCDSLWRPI